MEEKENVYEEIPQTEQIAEAKEKENDGSAVLGKFKSVDALARAYESLQSEFTRRSQRLKELEREAENFSGANAQRTEKSGDKTGVEKRRERAAWKRAEERKFDDFVSELERANACAPSETEKPVECAQQTTDTPVVTEGGLQEVSHSDVIPSVALCGDALYELASRDEEVRLKIIGEYLSSLGKSGAPLMKGGSGALTTPPLKPRSIGEAGSMALRFFKNGNAQA
ncbi:MAG: hypothetical protein IJX96_04455 [Clostridia bacterium]|nr:hypothetical protein [Clostridia bacterium]